MAFSKSLPKGQIPVGCQLCEGGNKIEWKCTDCNLLMCDRCKDKVHLRIAKDHRIVNIQEIGEHEDSWDRFVFSEVRCQHHPDQFCSLYCGTCNKIICLKCIVKVHNGHHFTDEEEFREKKEKLKEGQKKMKRNLTKVGSEKEKVIALEETDNAKLRNVKKSILDQRKQLHNAVDQYAVNLVQDLDKHFSTLKHKETQIEKKIQSMHLNNDALESIITSRDFTQFFRDFDQLNIKLHEDMSEDSLNISSLPNFSPGEFTVLNFGSLEDNTRLKDHHSKVEFKVTNQWTTELTNIHYFVRFPDGSVWIGDNANNLIQHVKLEKDKAKALASFKTKVIGLDVIPNNLLVSAFGSRLKLINGRTKQITDSVFDIGPSLEAWGIHITEDQKVVIAAKSTGPSFPVRGRRIVIVMDLAGTRLIEYEKESNNKLLFTLPTRVTSTSTKNICVVDRLFQNGEGRVVVIGQDGNTKGIYTGHHDVNTEDKPLIPLGILTTLDNILIADWTNHIIHILNNNGNSKSYFCLYDIGIEYPHSLALSTTGHVYIGCGGGKNTPIGFRAKIYEVEYSGI